jgi:hypothetical protein
MTPIELLAQLISLAKQYSVLIVLLLGVSYVVKERFFSPLANIPGPWLASISKSWFIYHSLGGKQHVVHLDSHKKYGPIWRAMPNYVLINDPAYLQKVYKWDRTDWYSAFNVKDTYVGVASTLSMESHNFKRKRLGTAV